MIKLITVFTLVLTSALLPSSEPSISSTKGLSEQNILTEEPSENLSELSEDDKKLKEIFHSLDWKKGGTHELIKSNSTISLPADCYLLLTQEDANKWRTATTGDDDDPSLEASVHALDFDNEILFRYFDEGYVSLDDWDDMDPNELIQDIIKNTEENNIERLKKNQLEIHVIGWLQEPYLDRKTNTVYWAIEIDQGTEEHTVNSVAFVFGRTGYEQLILVTGKESYDSSGGHLQMMLHSHSFNAGNRYTDHEKGDKIAGFGVATLVAATLGSKLMKLAGLGLILKKFGSFLLVAVAGGFYKIKDFFRRKR